MRQLSLSGSAALILFLLFSSFGHAQCADISYSGDCDGDGVINGLDLDNDNDGIYDTDEVDCASPAMNSGGYGYNSKLNPSNTASGTLTNLASYTGITAASPTYFDYYYEVQGNAEWGSGIRFLNNPFLGGDYINFQVTKSDLLSGDIGYVELNFNEYVTNLEFDLGGIDNQDAMTFLAYYNGSLVPAASIDIKNVNIPPANYHVTGNKVRSSSGGANAPFNTAHISVTGPVDKLVLRFAKENYNGVSTWQIYNFRYCIELNHDADGVPNRFDIDSDGDICYDVVEANFSDQDLNGILGEAPTLIDPSNGTVIGTNALVGYAPPNAAVTDGVAANSIDCGILLPVEMIGFIAMCENGETTARWSTASEINNDYFVVQSSEDGLIWEDNHTVKGVGNSTSISDYEVKNLNISERTEFIRIKQVDFDGASSYSYIVATPNCGSNQLHVFSNGNQVEISNPNTKAIDIQIYSTGGQLVSAMKIDQKAILELNAGMYIYSYESPAEGIVTGRFMIVQ